MTTALKPLWAQFPDIPWGSSGWRMGWGEKYWGEWQTFFLALNEEGRVGYRGSWPEPEGWKGLYAFIESGERPAWAVEHKRKLAGPYPLPNAEETRIAEHYRIVWLNPSVGLRYRITRMGKWSLTDHV